MNQSNNPPTAPMNEFYNNREIMKKSKTSLDDYEDISEAYEELLQICKAQDARIKELENWRARAVRELRDFCHDTCWHHTKEREMGCNKSPKDCRVKKLLLEAEGSEK